MPGQWDTGRHRGLEIAAIVLLLFSAMLDPRLTLALAAALIVLSGLVLLVATPYTVDWEVDQTGGERLHTGPMGG